MGTTNQKSLGQRAIDNAALTHTTARAHGFASGVADLHGTFNPAGHYSTPDAATHLDSRIGIDQSLSEGPIVGGDGSGMQTIVNATNHGWVLGAVLYPEGFGLYDVDAGDRVETWGSDRLDALYIVYGSTTIFGSALAYEIDYDLHHPAGGPVTPPTTPPPVMPPVQPPITPPTTPPSDPYTLTLASTGLQVAVTFNDPRYPLAGPIHASVEPGWSTPDSGAFWFFGVSNVEVVVKILRFNSDMCLIYAAPMTSVAWTLAVTDKAGKAVYGKAVTVDKPELVQDAFTFKA